VRLLETEVEHLRKDDPVLTAITSDNYKFSYRGTSQWEGRSIYVYQLKPRQKRRGLFKGRIYLDAYSGSLVRVEGRLVKSSSSSSEKSISCRTSPISTLSLSLCTFIRKLKLVL
jgi:hypothetical protein